MCNNNVISVNLLWYSFDAGTSIVRVSRQDDSGRRDSSDCAIELKNRYVTQHHSYYRSINP